MTANGGADKQTQASTAGNILHFQSLVLIVPTFRIDIRGILNNQDSARTRWLQRDQARRWDGTTPAATQSRWFGTFNASRRAGIRTPFPTTPPAATPPLSIGLNTTVRLQRALLGPKKKQALSRPAFLNRWIVSDIESRKASISGFASLFVQAQNTNTLFTQPRAGQLLCTATRDHALFSSFRQTLLLFLLQ